MAQEEPKKIDQSAAPTGNSGASSQPGPSFNLNSEAAQKTPGILQKLIGGDTKNPASSSDENAFTKLFGKKDATPTEAPSMGSRGPTLPPPPPTLSTLLGTKPTLSPRVLQEKEKSRTRMASILFKISLLLGVVTYLYFFSQLDPNFTLLADKMGPNVGQRFDSSNAEIERIQTDLNLVRYRTARLYIDAANGNVDGLFRQREIVNSNSVSPSQEQEAQAEFQILGATIKRSLTELQKILKQPLGVDIFTRTAMTTQEREAHYADLLKQRLSVEKARLTSENAAKNQDAIGEHDAILRLIDNTSFRSTIARADFASISETEFIDLLKVIRAQSTDELSSIEKIRATRVDWEKLIDRVHIVTKKVDSYYGQGLFQTIGGFLYTAYRFDATSRRVSINGITKTSDSRTFGRIATLVDAIEKSPYFKNIDFRSFAKNRDESGDYSSSINLDFAIQGESERDPRDDIPGPSNASTP